MFDLSALNVFGSTQVGAAVCVAVGLCIGFFGALFGVGGGFIVTPLLHAGFRMAASQAVATSMGQIPLMALSGVVHYLHRGLVDFRYAALLLSTSLPSAQAVAHWLGNVRAAPVGQVPVWGTLTVPDLVVIFCFTLLIGSVGLYNLRRGLRYDADMEKIAARGEAGAQLEVPPLARRPVLATLCTGIALGTCSALLGIGGGFIAVPLYTYVCNFLPVRAVATSLFSVLVTSAVTTMHFLWMGQVVVGISLLIAAGGVLGAQVGARAATATRPGRLLTTLGALQVVAASVYVGVKLGWPR